MAQVISGYGMSIRSNEEAPRPEDEEINSMNSTIIMTNILRCVLLLGVAAIQSAQAGTADIKIGKPLTTAAEAKQAADNWTGFDSWYADRAKADSGTTAIATRYEVPVSPFLFSQLKGRTCWKVTYSGISIVPDSKNIHPAGSRIRLFAETWIDSTTNQLVLLRLRQPDTPAVGVDLPTPEGMEADLRSGYEVYYGLPDTTPVVTLREVLSQLQWEPLIARETIIHYITYSYMMGMGGLLSTPQPEPGWSVYMRYSPDRNHETLTRRIIFNAMARDKALSPMVEVRAKQHSDSGRSTDR
jgi:hypothetical protein